MIITTLIEDKKHNTLKYEHGLSFSIIYNNKHYLLDAGSTPAFIDNSAELNIPLDNLKTCFLSHGHYDHSGGFKALIDKYPYINIYAMKNALEKRYSSSKGHFHEVGVQKELLQYKDHFIFIDQFTKIDEGIYIIPHKHSYEHIAKQAGMYKNETEYDDFSHELSVVFETSEGLILFNSCSHAGLKNIAQEVSEALNQPIYAYIGGLHLKGYQDGKEICLLSDEQIKETCDYIVEKNIKHIYTGHCSGETGYQKFSDQLKEKLHPLYTGLTIELK